MNKFEEAIENAPYSSDWYEQRCAIAHIVEDFIASEDCDGYGRYKLGNSDRNYNFIIFFKLYGNLYVWQDNIEDGRIESSQLDILYSESFGRVLYSNVENAPVGAPISYRLLKEGKLSEV